jgi:hypothetical protein
MADESNLTPVGPFQRLFAPARDAAAGAAVRPRREYRHRHRHGAAGDDADLQAALRCHGAGGYEPGHFLPRSQWHRLQSRPAQRHGRGARRGQLQRARMLLASDGFPRGDGVGFESLYREQEIGLSSFMEQARFQRALEMELSRTIAAWTACAARACTWPWPSQSAFLRQSERPAASVMLSLYRRPQPRRSAAGGYRAPGGVERSQPRSAAGLGGGPAGKLLSRQGIDEEFGLHAGAVPLHAPARGRLPPAHRRHPRHRLSGRTRCAPRSRRTWTSRASSAPARAMRRKPVCAANRPRRRFPTSALPAGFPGRLSNEPPLDTAVVPQQPGTVPLQPAAGAPAGDNGEVAAAQPPPARQSRSDAQLRDGQDHQPRARDTRDRCASCRLPWCSTTLRTPPTTAP